MTTAPTLQCQPPGRADLHASVPAERRRHQRGAADHRVSARDRVPWGHAVRHDRRTHSRGFHCT